MRQGFHEGFGATLEQFGGEKWFDGDVGGFDTIAALTRQDGDFAHHVHATKVHARVGFAVTVGLCQAHGFGKRHVGGEGIEHVVECAGQDGFDALDAVAGSDEIADGADDGQTGADVGFEKEFHSATACRVFQCRVVLERP